MAAVFPETVVKMPNGNYKAVYVDANGRRDESEITPEELGKMCVWSLELCFCNLFLIEGGIHSVPKDGHLGVFDFLY